MFQVSKNEPNYFTLAKKRVKLPKVKAAWEDKNIASIREKLREDILMNEQNSLCIYCEKKVSSDTKKSNIDHFKTRNLFPEESLIYDNLLVSCNTYNRCSSFKDKQVKSKVKYDDIVNPVIDNPENYFDYLLTGEIIAKNEKGDLTIALFALDSKVLVESRQQIVLSLKYFTTLSLEEIYDSFGYEYRSFIKAIYPKLKEL